MRPSAAAAWSPRNWRRRWRTAVTTSTSSAPSCRSAGAGARPACPFERVETPSYPLFREPQYLLALTNTLVQVVTPASARHHPRALRGAARHGRVSRAPDPVGGPRTRAADGDDAARHGHHARRQRSVLRRRRRVSRSRQSHGITAVSESLRARHVRGARDPQRDIGSFPTSSTTTRMGAAARSGAARAAVRAGDCEAVIVHVSNFRPVKRVELRARDLPAHPAAGAAPGS